MLLTHHQTGSLATDLNGKIRTSIPGIDLAHACKVQTWNGGRYFGDVPGMTHERNWLGILRSVDPDLLDPVWIEGRVDPLDSRDKALQQSIIAEIEIFMVIFEVITTVQDMISTEMFS